MVSRRKKSMSWKKANIMGGRTAMAMASLDRSILGVRSSARMKQRIRRTSCKRTQHRSDSHLLPEAAISLACIAMDYLSHCMAHGIAVCRRVTKSFGLIHRNVIPSRKISSQDGFCPMEAVGDGRLGSDLRQKEKC